MRYLKSFICSVMASIGLGCQNQPPQNVNTLPEPFVVCENDGIRHDVFRGMTIEEFTPQVPSGSIDSLDFDTTIQDYAIALVTAPREDGDARLQFTTTFVTDDQHQIVKAWTVASGHNGETACGLFLVPDNVASAKTVRTQAEIESLDSESPN
jgi:hypothetical protein